MYAEAAGTVGCDFDKLAAEQARSFEAIISAAGTNAETAEERRRRLASLRPWDGQD